MILKNKESYVLTKGYENIYTIRIGKNINSDDNQESKIIYVKKRRSIELLLLILQETVSIYYDDIKDNDEIFEWLNNKNYKEVLANIKFSHREEIDILKLINKIGLPKVIEICDERIDKKIVHKKDEGNVLISKGKSYGRMNIFNVFSKTKEIIMDHRNDDHIEGIVLFEIARQASIASVHLNSPNVAGVFVTLKSYVEYSKFVRENKPCFIQVTYVGKDEGLGICAFNIIQDGESCTSGYFTGYSYKDKSIYNDGKLDV